MSEATVTAHVSTEDIAGFLDRTLDAGNRGRVEAHLAECDECRGDLVGAWRALDSPRRQPSWRAAGVLAAAAAVAAILLFAPDTREGSSRSTPVLRAPGAAATEGVRRIVVVSPSETRSLHPDSVRFTWRGAEADALYRLVITDEWGDLVWTGSTSDTVLAPPTDSVVQRARAYFWYVDALLRDGTSATSGVRRFKTKP